MVYVVTGAIGFLTGWLSDHPRIARRRSAKMALAAISFALIGYAMVKVCASPDKLLIHSLWSTLGWVLAGTLLVSLVYSQFIEIPLKQAFLARGERQKVIRTGTYALVRHPAPALYGLLLGSLVLATGSKLLLLAAPIWLAMELIWVWLQDKYFFPRLLCGYEQYRQEAPMLFPSRRGLMRCFRALRRGKAGRELGPGF